MKSCKYAAVLAVDLQGDCDSRSEIFSFKICGSILQGTPGQESISCSVSCLMFRSNEQCVRSELSVVTLKFS